MGNKHQCQSRSSRGEGKGKEVIKSTILTKFGLWAGAIINLIYGILYVTGLVYTVQEGASMEEVKWAYKFFDGWKTCDVFFGLMLLGVGVLGIIVVNQLKAFRHMAPKNLNILYICAAAVSLIYIIWISSVLGDFADTEEFLSSAIVQIVVSGAMIAINTSYYKKRAHLFVNP